MVLFKTNFARNRSLLHWSDQHFYGFLRVDIINALSTTIHSMASAQFLATSSTPGSFGTLLHVSGTKFQDKFASLREINSPNSWNKFQICCTDMYLIRFLPNFVVFFVFLWISRDFVDLPEFHGSVTAQNIRSPAFFLYVTISFPKKSLQSFKPQEILWWLSCPPPTVTVMPDCPPLHTTSLSGCQNLIYIELYKM